MDGTWCAAAEEEPRQQEDVRQNEERQGDVQVEKEVPVERGAVRAGVRGQVPGEEAREDSQNEGHELIVEGVRLVSVAELGVVTDLRWATLHLDGTVHIAKGKAAVRSVSRAGECLSRMFAGVLLWRRVQGRIRSAGRTEVHLM